MRIASTESICILVGLAFTLSTCKSRTTDDKGSSLRIANASTASDYLRGVSALQRAAAQKAINATAFVETALGQCTGTVVSKYHVITANHCFVSEDHYRLIGKTAQVTVGGYKYHSVLVSYDKDYIQSPPTFWKDTFEKYSDLAILQTSSPMNVEPIAIADSKFVVKKMNDESKKSKSFDIGWVIGFGDMNTAGDNDGLKRIKEIEFTGDTAGPNDKMIAPFIRGSISEVDMSKGRPLPVRPHVAGIVCSGDSGGPNVILSQGQPVLIGITSFGGKCSEEIFYNATDIRLVKPEVLKPLVGFAQFVSAQPGTQSVNTPVSTPASAPGKLLPPSNSSDPDSAFEEMFGFKPSSVPSSPISPTAPNTPKPSEMTDAEFEDQFGFSPRSVSPVPARISSLIPESRQTCAMFPARGPDDDIGCRKLANICGVTFVSVQPTQIEEFIRNGVNYDCVVNGTSSSSDNGCDDMDRCTAIIQSSNR